jgi:hypothetical protein
MAVWERTHGVVRGAYMVAGTTRLYVREARGGQLGWLLYVDGELEVRADGEATAKAAAERVADMVAAQAAAGEAAAA